ncbi:MAG: hypothetical protein JNM33_03590 [Rubrivivax sp.]|nr:hypothetical protein [Rubrivivax sp.]
MSFPARCATLMSLCVTLAGCAPALDWRDVRPAGAALQLQFPCKPASQQRAVPLAGAVVPLTLLACDADGQTFALAVADLGDPARVEPALGELVAGAARNIGAPPASGRPQQPPGATPNAGNRRLSLQGRRPDGRPAHMALLVFTHGTAIFQATVLAETPGEGAADTFFASVRAGS